MSGQSDDIERLVESVADGDSVDWDALERAAPDEEARQLLRQLRLIAEVAEVHRSHVDAVVVAGDAAVTAPAVFAASEWPPPLTPHIRGASDPGADGAWGHLHLVRKIGEGSFGEVYQAHDTWLDHHVALKLLRREAEHRVPPSQLLHEARKLARVRHVNVVTVHGADRHNGRVGFWMDFVDGETLATRVGRGRLSAGEATSIGQEICGALAAVHRANIIHRDVKAQNVMRAHDGGRIILMDFGAGEFVDDPSFGKRAQGTPLYLAPELLLSGEASVRSDIYAVGVLLYHLVTSRFPVEASSQPALLEAHARGERRRLRDERPDLPQSFIAIVERAIDPDPARRYASAGDMEAKLSGEPSTRPVPAPPLPPPGPSTIDYLKQALAVVGTAVAVTGALGFIAVRAFEVILRIDPDFSLGLIDIFTVGAQGLLPFVVYWTLCAAVVGIVAGLRLLLPGRVAARLKELSAAAESVNPAGLGTVIFLVGSALFLALTRRYTEVFSVLWALRTDPLLPPATLSILNRASAGIGLHESQGIYSALLSFALGLAAWRWFPRLEKRARDVSTLRPLRWGTLAIGCLVVASAVLPRRVVWESFAIVAFDNRPALVIGTTEEELLLYAPDEAGRPRLRMPRDAAGLRLTGETRALFVQSR